MRDKVRHMTPTRIIIALLIILALGVAYSRFAPKDAIETAYSVCATCGMSESEVDGQVETFTGAKQSREQLMELYRQTFDDPAKIDCEDCAARSFILVQRRSDESSARTHGRS